MPGGVSSPVRSFAAVGGGPFFVARGEGARVVDADGRDYIDYVGSWGPLILGHAHPRVVREVAAAAARGLSFGACTEGEVRLAESVRRAFPGMERIRFVSSGTEATMSAVRLARAATGREAIVKCDGCYHGHADTLLVAAGSGAATLGLPGSAGVPEAVASRCFVIPYNDLAALERLLEEKGREIACLIVEPVAGNMGCVLPHPEYLAGLRRLTARHGVILIFDEVMTGFRVARGGAQERFDVRADLTTLGKIAGGGMPLGVYGGRADLMALVAPEGPVYQAGTLSGNPVAVAAGLATLEVLEEEAAQGRDPWRRLELLGGRLAAGLERAAEAAGVPARVNRAGSMLTLFFTDTPVTDFASARRTDTARFAAFFREMLAAGIFWPPSAFEAAFISLAHREEEIEVTIAEARRALERIGRDEGRTGPPA
jgi:glutamate-1-semialdehyde 2,1-aminomutase